MSVIMEETSRAGTGPVTGYRELTEEDKKYAAYLRRKFEEEFLHITPKD